MDVLDRYSDVDPSLARPDEPHAVRRGINVHAKLSVAGNDRAQLERLCRYLGRPPIAQERLECLSDGRLRYTFKKAWKDGTRAIARVLGGRAHSLRSRGPPAATAAVALWLTCGRVVFWNTVAMPSCV
jgi:hypothetical protein